jgi:hypothetical protein
VIDKIETSGVQPCFSVSYKSNISVAYINFMLLNFNPTYPPVFLTTKLTYYTKNRLSQTVLLAKSRYYSSVQFGPGLGNVRPEGHMRPAKHCNVAREHFLGSPLRYLVC